MYLIVYTVSDKCEYIIYEAVRPYVTVYYKLKLKCVKNFTPLFILLTFGRFTFTFEEKNNNFFSHSMLCSTHTSKLIQYTNTPLHRIRICLLPPLVKVFTVLNTRLNPRIHEYMNIFMNTLSPVYS